MIHSYFLQHRDEIVETLKELVRVPSVRSAAEENAPYGRQCARALEVVQELHRKNGFETELHAASGYLLSRSAGSGEGTLGIFAHADVVPPGEDWVYTDPFDPIEKDGFLIGRGVEDNKAGIVCSLFVARAIRELGLPQKKTLVLYTGSNEESGMRDIQTYRKEQTPPDISLVPDVTFPVYRGEKGKFRFWAIAPRAEGQLMDIHGGEAFNIVLGKAQARLRVMPGLYEALVAAADEHVTVTLEADEIVLNAKGIARHACIPQGSLNATWLLAKTLARCEMLADAQRKVFIQAEKLLSDHYGAGFGIENTDPGFGKLTCVNGMVSYDGQLSLSFDVRYGTVVDAMELENTVRSLLNEMGWSLKIQENDPGYELPEDDPMIQGLFDIYTKCTGDENGVIYLNGGASYARHIPHSAATGVSFKPPIPFPMPDGHGGVHQPDECLHIDSMLQAMSILLEMVLFCDSL